MSTYLIRAMSFLPEGLVIEYSTPDDMRSNGLMQQHALSIPATEEYAERLDDLVETAQALLAAALADLTTYPPLGADDEEVSPWDNPLEREGVPDGEAPK